MIQMFITKVAVDRQGRALVFLSDADNRRTLPIWIGYAEAQAIVSQMKDAEFPRPMTHDLLKSVIEQTGYAVVRIRITQLEEKTFFAAIDLSGPSGEIEVDSRPSDAIALALRCGAPIHVAERVLDEAEIPSDKAEEEELETFRRLMGTMAEDVDALDLDPESDTDMEPDDEAPESQED